MKLRRNDKIEIIWIDTYQVSAWMPVEKAEMMKAPVCRSLGYFTNHDDDVLRMSDTCAEDNDRNCTIIPWGSIKKITKLQEK